MDKETIIHDHMKRLGQKGGTAHTEAQRLARQENARKMREAKLRKRYGTMTEGECQKTSSE